MYREMPFGEMTENIIFWRGWDGKVDGQRVYAPRRTYILTHDGKVRDISEFGRTWAPSDCGLTPETLVGTIGQPIR